MAEEKLENLSIDELRKRKIFFTFILGALMGVLLFNIIIAIVKGNLSLIAISSALLVTCLFPFIVIKKINEELQRRYNK